MTGRIRFLVVSDLHAIHDKSHSNDSRLCFESGESEFGEAFLKYAKGLNQHVDVLICPGDISNKADIKCFEQGWLFLNRIKKELNIAEIFCVPGNHDHQSRQNPGVFDPKHYLQFISPSFPFDCPEKNTHFWGWHWCHSSLEHFNVISLNSSAYHGYGDEDEHGRVATEITDQVAEYINSDRFLKKPFNLLVCHHHPEKMDYVDEDYDCQVMEGGSYLIRKLDEANKGPWLIVHGHKHFADVVYARSAYSCPTTVFSAGSLSAMLYPSIRTRTSNQFYTLEVDLRETERIDRVVGEFNAYDWRVGSGWQPSKADFLPASGGFGNVIAPKTIVNDITSLIEESPPFLNGKDLEIFEEKLKYFTPSEFKQLVEMLRDGGFEVIEENNRIIQVGRPHDK